MSATACLAAGLLVAAEAVALAVFPEPAALEPQVRFWERVYSEWRSDQVVFHDTEHLDVVYRVVDLGDLRVFPRPDDAGERGRQFRARRRLIEAHLVELREAIVRAERGEAVDEVAAAWSGRRPVPGGAARLRWQYGLRDRFAGGLARFDVFGPAVEVVFEAEGLPRGLAALGLVESLYDPEARSSSGAVGLFQLMPATGRELGLSRTRLYDERRDPLRSAAAAARMLAKNRSRLGSWPLAITGYNHGPNGVARAVRQVGSEDLMDLIARYSSPSWGFASRNFYAEFLAARRVLAARHEHFGDWVPPPPYAVRPTELPRPARLADLERHGCVDGALFRDLNPHLLRPVTDGGAPVPQGHVVNLPENAEPEAFVRCAAIAGRSTEAVRRAATRGYRVRPGDTLWDIARREGVPVERLRRINRLGDDGFIVAGELIRLPAK